MDETLNELPGRPLLKVCTCGQCRQVTYNDVPNRHTMTGDVGGVQGYEAHGDERLVLGETQKKDPMSLVWS